MCVKASRAFARPLSVSTATTSIDYAKLRQDLVKVVARICTGWLADRRDDVVQAAVMRVMQIAEKNAAEDERDPPLASSYLYKVAYSVLVDEIRRVRRRNELSLEEDVIMPAATTADPERVTASREIGRGILHCLTQMNRERRLAVTLYLQGHSVPDASRILDWSPKRTENLVYRGLADLRECLLSKGMRP
jgi:RNA polymerase sigma-70 factor, ECF subfamily